MQSFAGAAVGSCHKIEGIFYDAITIKHPAPGYLIMKNEQKEKFKHHITDKIQRLKKDIISYKELTRPISPDNAIGRISRMEAINSKSINEEALRKVENTLVKLAHALKIIDDEDFGICIACDAPIPFARLMILPETNLCVACAEKLTG